MSKSTQFSDRFVESSPQSVSQAGPLHVPETKKGKTQKNYQNAQLREQLCRGADCKPWPLCTV